MRQAEDIRAEAALRAADAEQWRATFGAEAKAYALASLPGMIACEPDGRTRGLDDVLSDIGQLAGVAFERTIDRVSISDNVGILMGRERALNEGPCALRFMHVYLYRDGRWRMMARHAAHWH
jgi:hypothetical protein